MNQPQNPAKLPSTALPPASDTVRMSDSVTEEEVDALVREALAASSQLQVCSDSANSLLARLADLKIIRALAGESQKLESIGPFEFLEEIGRGGMGAVYKARHRQLGKIQAVKVIHTDGTSNPELLARFKREVRAIGSLSHPNIIAAHHADIENGSPYLVMDYVEGDSLSNIQKNLKSSGRQISVAAACEVIRQASLGIQYAHEQEITHRDIKPGNMVLDRHGVVRVLDLGLAQLRGQETETEVTELTRGEQILGTPDFMSPEQLRSTRSVDSRTDIYSLGATLYVLLTGSTLYPSQAGEGFIAKANRILNDPVPDARKLRPEIPKQLAQIVSKCLQKSADKRFQTAGELAQALETWSNAEELDELQPRLSGASGHKSHSPKSTLKSALPSANRRLPPRNVWMAIVGGLFLLPVLAGILIRLTIPGVGELIIESSDPNVTVLLRQVDGLGSQSLQVQQGPNKATSIRVGDWDIEIQGVDASRLLVTPSRVEIGRNQPTVVRIERKPLAEIAEGPSRESASPDTGSDSIASSAPQPNTATETLKLAPAQFAMEQGWTPGDVQRIRPGLVPQPANVDALFDWQLQLIRTPSGITEDDYPYLRHLDPQGKLVAWIVAQNVLVADIETGTILQVIPNVDGTTVGIGTLLARQETSLSLATQNGASVEIRSRAGQLLERWKTNANFRFGIQAWLPKEQHLALANESKVARFLISREAHCRNSISP
jgi:serine/threonine protein kinase